MPKQLVYHIYSHADSDGGIAAALFSRFIIDQYGCYGWKIEIHPVNHGPGHPE
jgi:oligoribonuclease NrnB/cAMP/cGMP phosphodiesterase (DHH superfamily)